MSSDLLDFAGVLVLGAVFGVGEGFVVDVVRVLERVLIVGSKQKRIQTPRRMTRLRSSAANWTKARPPKAWFSSFTACHFRRAHPSESLTKLLLASEVRSVLY